MTFLARTRLNTALGLAIPAAAFLYLTSGGLPSSHPANGAVVIGVAVLWLAAVVRLNTLPLGRRSHVRAMRDVDSEAGAPAPAIKEPPYVVSVTRPIAPWRWTSMLIVPLELLAVAWALPVMILLIMVPVGLGLVGALWLGARIFELF